MVDRVAPADWYADYDDPALERFWDGSRWTGHLRRRELPQPSALARWQAQAIQAVQSGFRFVRPWVQTGLGVVILGGLVMGRWPIELEGVPLVLVFGLLSSFAPDVPTSAGRQVRVVEMAVLTAVAFGPAVRFGGWPVALATIALLGAGIGLTRHGDRLPGWFRWTADVVVLGLVLVVAMPFLFTTDPSWRLL